MFFFLPNNIVNNIDVNWLSPRQNGRRFKGVIYICICHGQRSSHRLFEMHWRLLLKHRSVDKLLPEPMTAPFTLLYTLPSPNYSTSILPQSSIFQFWALKTFLFCTNPLIRDSLNMETALPAHRNDPSLIYALLYIFIVKITTISPSNVWDKKEVWAKCLPPFHVG